MSRIQDLEQLILRDQRIIMDLDDLFEGVCEHDLNTDQISNMLLGIMELYKIRHEKTWDCYTEVVREYYKFRKEAGYNYDSIVDIENDGPDLWSKDFSDWKPGHPQYDAAMAELEKQYDATASKSYDEVHGHELSQDDEDAKPDAWVVEVGEKPTEKEKASWPAKQTRKKKK